MGTHVRSLRPAWAAGMACLLLAACAARGPAPELVFEAPLSGAQELPAVSTGASGHAQAHYDHRTQLLHWRVTHAGLSGPATGVHIHGPAGPGQEADIVLPLGNPGVEPLTGRARITPEQWNQLDSGQWYVDVHTARHPAGEIRGQLRPRP